MHTATDRGNVPDAFSHHLRARSDRIIIFVGPTIRAEDAVSILPAEYHGPVSQGDVYRATQEDPFAIGIIDGYFRDQPSVWHKEILWALSSGIYVYGSASMGALRAAELARFGMEGVGEIFEAFRSGTLEDDDEVALLHGQPEAGYRAYSEPLVNIRSTLRRAEYRGIISAELRDMLTGIAKAMYYPERGYEGLLREARATSIPEAQSRQLEQLRQWLPGNAVDQKRLDAVAMLHALRDRRTSCPGPKRVTFSFHHTDSWQYFIQT